jgi:glycosyltransferase involved in cell wall biosynthesis
MERLRSTPFRKLVTWHAKNSERTISLGRPLTEILVRDAGVDPERIREIPNAVDLTRFQPGTGAARERRLLFVGRLAFNKGIDLLVASMRRMKGFPLQLTIVGDGPLAAEVERLSKEDRRVRFLGPLDEDRLREEYASHEALLFTSRFEGMPTVILEAMASGCAIIATRIGAVEEMVSESNGVLVSPDSASISEGIRSYFSLDSEARRRKGDQGRRLVQEKFAWLKIVNEYAHLFSEFK